MATGWQLVFTRATASGSLALNERDKFPSHRLALRIKPCRYAFGGRIGLSHDLRHEIDIRQAPESKWADGKKPLGRAAIHGKRARCFDSQAETEFVRCGEARVDQAPHQWRVEIRLLAAAVDHLVRIDL